MCETQRALETANKVYNKRDTRFWHLMIDVCLIAGIAIVVVGSVLVFFIR